MPKDKGYGNSEFFESDKEPSTHGEWGGKSGAGHSAPVDDELGNHVATGNNPEQKHFDN